MTLSHDEQAEQLLRMIERGLIRRARELAVLLVFDRPERVAERPGLGRTFFAQRCASDEQLQRMIDALRSVGAYVELFAGEHPFFAALANDRLKEIKRDLMVVYNGIENFVGIDGFEPGRKALLPAVADSYRLICTNSDAYGCALGRHKFHYFTILHALGIRTPPVWHYRPDYGWAGGRKPPYDARVIVKSTYESWSVGVTDASIFVVDDTCEAKVSSIAQAIGQSVTVQEFIPGVEVNVPVYSFPNHVVTPPVESVLTKAPGDVNAVVTIEDSLSNAGLTYRPFEAAPDVMARLRDTASAAFNALELKAFARIDFRVDESQQIWVTDVGVAPGLAPQGSASQSLAALGFDHPSFLRVVFGATLEAHGLLS